MSHLCLVILLYLSPVLPFVLGSVCPLCFHPAVSCAFHSSNSPFKLPVVWIWFVCFLSSFVCYLCFWTVGFYLIKVHLLLDFGSPLCLHTLQVSASAAEIENALTPPASPRLILLGKHFIVFVKLVLLRDFIDVYIK